ncbi:yjeF C-terminal region, hydroxyethylthiazole kinase-related/yjeF N-terminal region [Andreprevotia lacus DSM 23236]|jgi:hydroxyethylthiazole kinase-like uncharacterized protein yjeF|uniref:Bifunctional NAD(P)H-hydrate repair enzyme n=1 Tax=Andreprevotia lacus DSM 23236 TaxID=1121001 RepID=A0A1W1Y289_9NEIS|nr:NAD(P)H-hydrate dehydratase [Andreprevotia lacus]SMC29901.1 yjeF C-terminal region, hydroxyethylthiazole kinase-related/yjeF N-terminal region [Andreprevotia lacus DSM 23236]
MKALLTIAALRDLELAAHGMDLISRAGSASARWLLANTPADAGFSVLIGPGNNGQDALVCAQQLQDAGRVVQLRLLPGDPRHDELAARFAMVDHQTDGHWQQVIVDGLFGIGLNRPPDAAAAALIDAANRVPGLRVALDIPSGLDADHGTAAKPTFIAAHTLSFLADKPGLYTADGRDHAGQIHTFDLGVSQPLPTSSIHLIDRRSDLPMLSRQHASHKGSHGCVAIIGGCAGMAGATLLAGRAALHAGAGKVVLGLLDEGIHVDFGQPELMLQAPAQVFEQAEADVCVVGPGLGQSAAALAWLQQALTVDTPLVIDADGLNLIAQSGALQQQLHQRQAPTVLTPHPAEAGRLLQQSTTAIQARRLPSALQLARQYRCTVLLKGSGTVCSDGEVCSINHSGNALLANAGQGDVLSGLLGVLLAQGLPALAAAQLASFSHGRCADLALQAQPALLTLPATAVIAQLARILNQPDD